MRVHQIMTQRPITVGPEESLADAAAKLGITRLHVLPVVDGHNRLLGLLHERDLQGRVREAQPEAQGLSLHLLARFVLPDQTVRAHMCPPSATLQGGVPIREAAWKMLEHGVHGLAIVNGAGVLRGVFTVTDLMKAVVQGDLVVLGA